MAARNITRVPPVPAGMLSCPGAEAPWAGERRRVYLLPGELHASAEPCQITTILGSCVAVCLFDLQLRVGGMNHYILPAGCEGEGSSTRFADIAMQALLQRMMQLGCTRRDLAAKVFGGSAQWNSQRPYAASLGAKNVETAREQLQRASIPIVAEDTGGIPGRKIIFHTDDGSVWSRKV